MRLGAALQDLGKLDEAHVSYHRALAIKPGYAKAHSNLIVCMNYDEHYSQQEIFAESRRWEAAHAATATTREVSHSHDRDPERRLRQMYAYPDRRPPETKSEATLERNREMLHHYHGSAVRDDELIARLGGTEHDCGAGDRASHGAETRTLCPINCWI